MTEKNLADDGTDGLSVKESFENFAELFSERQLPKLVERGQLTQEEADDIRAFLSDFRTEEDVNRVLVHGFNKILDTDMDPEKFEDVGPSDER